MHPNLKYLQEMLLKSAWFSIPCVVISLLIVFSHKASIPFPRKVELDPVDILIQLVVVYTSSYLGYRLGWKTSKMEALLAERIASFKEISKTLLNIERYCDEIEFEGEDLGPGKKETQSAFTLSEDLYEKEREHSVFLSKDINAKIEELHSSLRLAASMELACISNSDLSDDMSVYKSIASSARSLRSDFYKKMKLGSNC